MSPEPSVSLTTHAMSLSGPSTSLDAGRPSPRAASSLRQSPAVQPT